MKLDLQQHDTGTVLPIKALPGSSKNELRGIHDGRLKVCVTQIAEKGKANKAIIRFIASILDLPRGDVSIVSGHSSNEKQLLLKNINPQDVTSQLSNFLN